jgi:hypothetical protein
LPEDVPAGARIEADGAVFVVFDAANPTNLDAFIRGSVAATGSARKAARLIGIPRSTIGDWLRKGADRGPADADHHAPQPGPETGASRSRSWPRLGRINDRKTHP